MDILKYCIPVPLWFLVIFPLAIATTEGTLTEMTYHEGILPGAVLWATGASGYIWCAWTLVQGGRGTPSPLKPPRRLVRVGPYAFVRNPVFLFFTLALAGDVSMARSTAVAVYAAVIVVSMYIFAVCYEEGYLKRQFGSAYESYSAEVPAWFPRLRHRSLREGKDYR